MLLYSVGTGPMMLFAGEVVSIAALLTSVYDDGVGEEKQEEKAWS